MTDKSHIPYLSQPGGKCEVALREVLELRREQIAKRHALRDDMGATGLYSNEIEVQGFIYPHRDNVKGKGWKIEDANVIDNPEAVIAKPDRKTPAGKVLCKLFRKLPSLAGASHFSAKIGFKPVFDASSFLFKPAYAEFVNDKCLVYIPLPSNFVPPDCERLEWDACLALRKKPEEAAA